MPAFEESVLPAGWGDSVECDEIWAIVGSKKNPVWIWLGWSFLSTQTLSFAIGARDEATGRSMWRGIPKSYARKQVYTDGYVVYESLIPWWRHWVCPKGSGDTCIAEGCNNYLRHRTHSVGTRLSGSQEFFVLPERGLAVSSFVSGVVSAQRAHQGVVRQQQLK